MCISSPSKNITVRRRRQTRAKQQRDNNTRCVVEEQKASSFEDSSSSDEEFNASTRSRFCKTTFIMSPTSAKHRRISDELDINACKSATKDLQDVVPSIASTSEESQSESEISQNNVQSSSSPVEPVELFISPQSAAASSQSNCQPWTSKVCKVIFAILGILELCTIIVYPQFSAATAATTTTINHAFMMSLVIHSIVSAKTAAFAYSTQQQPFDRTASKRTKPTWNSERLHLFVSLLLFRLVLLPIFKNETTKAAGSPMVAHCIAEMTLMKFQSALSLQINLLFRSLKSHVSKEIAVLVLTNPFSLHVRLQQLFTFLRWAKFLAPLIGTLNKFKGHCVDLRTKWVQRRRSRRAQQLWDDALRGVVARHRLDAAVLRIQRNFRSKRETKAERRMRLLMERRGKKSAAKIQQRLEEEATRAREGISRIDKVMSEAFKRRIVSAKDKKQMMNHKDGVRKNRVFLFRPNTTFAVSWKVVTATCVLLEVSSIALAPGLSGEMKKMPLDQFIQSCATSLMSSEPTDVAMLWASAANQLADALAAVVPVISFLDVFITFLTGELCPETGALIPKAFFPRWILPGVCLQLLINPAMKGTSQLLRVVATFASQRIGWAKVLNIVIAVQPLLQFVWCCFVECLHRFIEIENKKISASFIA